MSEWRSLALADACEINVGRTPARANPAFWGNDHPWLSIADMNQGRWIDQTKECITTAGTGGRAPVKAGTVLLSFKLSIGKVARARFPLYTNEAIAALPIKPGVDISEAYLSRYLESLPISNSANRAAMGATLNKKALASLEVRFPDRENQVRITSILDQADAIRTKRRAQLAHLDELSQALFHETFGKRFDRTRPLSDVAFSIDSGLSPVAETRAATANEWGVLKLSAVSYGEFRWWENKAFLGNPEILKRHEVKQGDVLMTRKNTPELVGAVALIRDTPARRAIPDLIFRINFNHELIDGTYAQSLLMSPSIRRRVRNLAGGSAASMSNISKARLSNLQIPLPPLSIQQNFAAQVQAIHAERDRVAKALEADEELFAALQHRAFRDEH